MAKFEGVHWGPCQLQYLLDDRQMNILPAKAKAYTVSRSIHYGLFLVFEGIRFYVKHNNGEYEIRFLNWHKNLNRFRQGILFSLSSKQRENAPTEQELERVFLQFFQQDALRDFLIEMSESNAQGYFRPYTLDEDQSIGVTFPALPAIRATLCRYDRYLGEPFEGVVIPHLVRAVKANKTGSLKLGTNYLISVKAVEAAQELVEGAGAALFLDDRTESPLYEREITEWDSSCCLFALRDGSLIKIPEGPLILPSVTIQGIVALAKEEGIPVVERPMTYGELVKRVQSDDLITICSIGTAGILNRCERLHLINEDKRIIAVHHADTSHALYHKLEELRQKYWALYTEEVEAPPTVKRYDYTLD